MPGQEDEAQPPMNPAQMLGGTAEASDPGVQASAQEVHTLLTGLAQEVAATAKRFPAFSPFAEQINSLLTEGFFAIQEQVDAAAPPQQAPRYL